MPHVALAVHGIKEEVQGEAWVSGSCGGASLALTSPGMTLGAKGETAVKLGRGGIWPSTHADAVAVAELAANPRFAPTCPLSPQSLSWRYRI